MECLERWHRCVRAVEAAYERSDFGLPRDISVHKGSGASELREMGTRAAIQAGVSSVALEGLRRRI